MSGLLEGDRSLTISTVNGCPTMPVTSVRRPADYQPIRCLLEMFDDGQVAVIVKPGCSVADVHDMLRQLADCDGHFQHVTFVDEHEPEDTT
jgi:hypothetical protein